jgi:hypothetical protein
MKNQDEQRKKRSYYYYQNTSSASLSPIVSTPSNVNLEELHSLPVHKLSSKMQLMVFLINSANYTS